MEFLILPEESSVTLLLLRKADRSLLNAGLHQQTLSVSYCICFMYHTHMKDIVYIVLIHFHEQNWFYSLDRFKVHLPPASCSQTFKRLLALYYSSNFVSITRGVIMACIYQDQKC